MNNVLNLSLIEGTVDNDPEMFYSESGQAICKMIVIVNFKTKINGETHEEVTPITVNTWNRVAEAAYQYIKKGARIRVRGRLKMDKWTDKNGETKEKIYIESQMLEFLSGGK